MIIIAIIISTLSSLYILPRILEFLARNRIEAKNYNNIVVYNSAGIFFYFNILLICTGLITAEVYIYKRYPSRQIMSIIIAALTAAFAGYLDDNSKDASKGIIGHGRMLLNGQLSSGSIKALVGILASFLICIIMEYNGFDFIINIALISLMQNLINLLDLRPGRAVKFYIALSLIVVPFIGYNSIYASINSGIMVSLFFYLGYELNEISMMGDTGSNVLGIVLGVISASSKGTSFRLVLLAFLLCIQVYAERKSINSLIEKNPVLNYIDMMGRHGNFHDKNKKGSS